ncbi:MAG TPA: 4-hydroxy-tetrahydrodipicolinate reductase [bacterium]|nr:4-hydroxy-tetrahydrodipicolinate reductase [bacterium]
MAVHRVVVAGAAGRMGRAAVRTIARREDMVLVGALGRTASVGQDAGSVAGAGAIGVPITTDLSQIFLGGKPTVLVDFGRGDAAVAHAEAALDRRVPSVVGATGLPAEGVQRLRDRCRAEQVGCLIAPNFALGAILMMEFARRAARFFPHVEITELHHDRKRDAPSGTAARTAQLIADARGPAPAPAVVETELVAGARGGLVAGIHVHSVRLPGLVAHQEVLFGGPGQTLTIRHDSTSEESFMPGLVLAIQNVGTLRELVEGLESVLDL